MSVLEAPTKTGGPSRRRPPPSAAHAEGPPSRSASARRRARAIDRSATPPRSADRASASDPGSLRLSLRRAPRRARRRDEDGAHRSIRGRDFLRAFRCGEGRRHAAGADHRARLQFTLLRHGRRGEALEGTARKARPASARRARALHGRLRSRAGRRGRSRADLRCNAGQCFRRREGQAARACLDTGRRFCRVSKSRRLRVAARLPLREALARRHDQDRERRRPTRSRRRRLPDRTQVVAGARRARAAPDGGELRRRRAGHLQGPFLSRARSASLHRRHADRRLGGRSTRHLSLCARRISGSPPNAGRGDRQGGSRGPQRAHQTAPAARRRRLHLRRRVGDDRVRSKASAGCRAIARLMSRKSACSAARRSSRMSRRCSGCATSSRRARRG